MSLILGCANSLQAHSVYADFLEDSGKDTSFFRIFLQMRRTAYFTFDEGWDDFEYFEDYFYKRGFEANLGTGYGDGDYYGNYNGDSFYE